MNLQKWTALKNIAMAVVGFVAAALVFLEIAGVALGPAVTNALLVLEMLALAAWLFASMKVVIHKTGGKK